MNSKIDQIQRLLTELQFDYEPSVQEVRNFHYAYRLLIAFAKHLCSDDGHIWTELGSTSRSIYLIRARDAAHIDHDEFLTHIRDGAYHVDDLYEGENDDE